jgi:serine phosphatase RsbU (regulator of sigma subunit)
MEPAACPPSPGAASLAVMEPNGRRARIAVDPLPFQIGRSPESNLVLRDSRISRSHARIVADGGGYAVEDCGSRHGTFINGQRVGRQALRDGDRIEFGAPDSYALIFSIEGAELKRLMERVEAPPATIPGAGAGLGRLRAILDLARAVQGAFPVDDVLASVVDAALAITGAERGFLMLRSGEGLETRIARSRDGRRLKDSDLRVPRELLRQALERRRELLYMNFDPVEAASTGPGNSIADLELRSVICVPLVRIRAAQGDETSTFSTLGETAGLLYLDSRLRAADLAGGNRELIQALAIEASTVLENARLLEEEQAKQALEEELKLARSIQQSLLPRELPRECWVAAAGSSLASREVGGDYFDVNEVAADCWSAVVADVSGKGVSSALLASLLQGALLAATDHPPAMQRRLERLNRFLLDRTGGEKYATVFHCLLRRDGRLSYVNAAHCPPLLIRAGGELSELEATAFPVGLLEGAQFEVSEIRLAPGEKLLIYSDGVTESQNSEGAFFGRKRLRAAIAPHLRDNAAALHGAVLESVAAFTAGATQSDDITVLALEYRGA